MLYDIADAPEVMRWYRELVPALPEELSGWLGLITIPPAPPFPEQLWGRKACAIVWCYTGPHDRAEDILAPVREFGSPLVVGLHEMPFTALQSAFDPLYPAGLQWYWRADYFREISDAAIDVHREFGERLPTGHSTMHLYPIDGAAARVAPDATAFAYRDGGWAGVIVGVDPDPAQAELISGLGEGVLGAAAPHLGRQRLPQLRHGRGHGPGARVLPRQLRAADADQAPLRPGQHVPHQPEHPARRAGLKAPPNLTDSGRTARRGAPHEQETDHDRDDRRPTADRALKARHRAMWALGDYPAVAIDVIPELGPALVAASGVRAGDRVLDVAAGTGNAAVPAALAGARVIASDLTPELFAAGRAFADRHGVQLEWAEGDAEALPYADGAFDVVLSCVGVMFAPHHQQAADELVRVCRPGGTIGLLSWTPQGFVGELFRTMKPYAPPPPPGAQPPPLWGDEDHVRTAARRPGHRRRRPAADADHRTCSRRPRRGGSTGRPSTGRPSRCTATSPTTPSGSRPSTATSPPSPPGSTAAPRSTVMDWEYLILTARTRG